MDDFVEKAEFNDAISFLNRINICIINCNNAAANLDAFSWYNSQLCFYRELSGYIIGDEKRKEFDIAFDAIHADLPSTRIGSITHETYRKLHNQEIKLRDVYKASGLQMKETTDPRLRR